MDIFMPIAICVIFIILFSICGWCCKRKREGTVYGYGTNVTVTTSQPHQPTPVVAPPYPVDVRHPTPYTAAVPGFTTHTPPYPTHPQHPQPGITPYPSVGGSTPYPPPAGGAPYPPVGGPAYPPVSGSGDYNAHPPPYDVAVATPPVRPQPVTEAYGKQAPYNPNFS